MWNIWSYSTLLRHLAQLFQVDVLFFLLFLWGAWGGGGCAIGVFGQPDHRNVSSRFSYILFMCIWQTSLPEWTLLMDYIDISSHTSMIKMMPVKCRWSPAQKHFHFEWMILNLASIDTSSSVYELKEVLFFSFFRIRTPNVCGKIPAKLL